MRKEITELLLQAAAPLVELAVTEDVGPGDATSEAILPANARLHGRIVAKESGVIAGLSVAEAVFRRVADGSASAGREQKEDSIDFVAHVTDGQEVVPGELVAEVQGPARVILAAERTALNFLQRMSGVATLTRRFVDAAACSDALILDTRKTLPGYRLLDKYAVRVGGGTNHRMSLYDMILIKDNHIDAAGGIGPAVARARASYARLPIEVEVRNLDELRQVLAIEPAVDRVMLDNMTLEQMRQAVSMTEGRVVLEASGNVTLERVAEIATTGVDFISTGALTHSARALDLSMKVAVPEEGVPGPTLASEVAEIKAGLGERLFILGHHYQRDEVLAVADARGDSLKLARDATQTDAEFIVFCGVHFMAETAAILAKPHQRVLIPDVTAGCFLADTASAPVVQAAWDELDAIFGNAEAEFTPITYVNSSAALKAFCGRHGGIVCTSGNAEEVLRWALAQRPRVFFFPDQHLGRNTARRMGIELSEILLWGGDQHRGSGEQAGPGRDVRVPGTLSDIRQAKVLLWPGSCNVHQRFRAGHVRALRKRFPGIRILVHPECRMEVADLADEVGSTAFILQQVEAAPPGTRWAIGTETRLVDRIQQQHPEQQIMSLADIPPFCRTMSQITLQNLAQVLREVAAGELIHEITVETETAHWARLALERMLAI